MKRSVPFFFLIAVLALLAGCAHTARVTSSHEVRIDSVSHAVPLPGHTLETDFLPADSLHFSDDKLDITIWRLPQIPDSSEAQISPESVEVSAEGTDNTLREFIKGEQRFRLRAKVKADTVRVEVPQKTITDRKETVKYVSKTPGFMWVITGALVMLILVLVVAWKIRQS